MENKRTADDLLDALETVASMDVEEQYRYFNLRADITNCYEGLYEVISTHTADEIFDTVKRYSDDKIAARVQKEKEMVRNLAELLGIHKLYAYVAEMRGEP